MLAQVSDVCDRLIINSVIDLAWHGIEFVLFFELNFISVTTYTQFHKHNMNIKCNRGDPLETPEGLYRRPPEHNTLWTLIIIKVN